MELKFTTGRYTIFMLFIIIFFTACKKDKNEYERVVSLEKIWSAKNYSAFTDLVLFNGTWYCVFREAENHVGTIGTIRVLESQNGIDWRSNSLIQYTNEDLRDPKFLVNKNGDLVIHSSAVNRHQRYLKNLFWTLEGGKKWGEPREIAIKDHWLWSIKNYKNQYYAIGYNVYGNGRLGGLSFFSTSNAPKTLVSSQSPETSSEFPFSQRNLDLAGCPTEAGFTFLPDGRLVTIARRDCDGGSSFLGIASYPFEEFAWYDLKIVLQSPNLLYDRGVIYVAGRAYRPESRTSIFTLNMDSKTLDFYTNLRSDADSGYPGMLVKNGHLYVSYYSSDGGDHRAIYLAKVKLNGEP